MIKERGVIEESESPIPLSVLADPIIDIVARDFLVDVEKGHDDLPA